MANLQDLKGYLPNSGSGAAAGAENWPQGGFAKGLSGMGAADIGLFVTAPVTDKEELKRVGYYGLNFGELTIGGLNRDLYTGDISYIPLVSPTEWQVSLDGIKVNGVDVAVAVDPPPARPPTAHIQLPHDNIWIKEALLHIVMGQIPGATWLLSSNNDIVYHVPCSITSTITFRLGGKEYTVPAWAWVMPDYVGTGRCMSQIMSTRVADPSSLSSVVLGQPFLMTVYTAFKVAESPQIGFVPLSEAALNVETEYVERLGAQPSGTIPGHATGGNTATPAPIGSAGTGSAAPNAAGDGTRAAASGLGPPSNAATRAALSAALLVAAFTITVALGA